MLRSAAGSTLTRNKAVTGASACQMDGSLIVHNSLIWYNLPSANSLVGAASLQIFGTNSQPGSFTLPSTTPPSGNTSVEPALAYDQYHLTGQPVATLGLGRVEVAQLPQNQITNPWLLDLEQEVRPCTTANRPEAGCDEFLDSDGDSLPDWYEKGIQSMLPNLLAVTPQTLLSGSTITAGDYWFKGANPFDLSADSDGDGVSDRRELTLSGLGQNFNPRSADSDGNGTRDIDPEDLNTADKDSDGDGLVNGEDAVPWDKKLHFKRVPESTYVYMSLGPGWAQSINDRNEVLIMPYTPILSGPYAAPFQFRIWNAAEGLSRPVTLGAQAPLFHWNPDDASLQWYVRDLDNNGRISIDHAVPISNANPWRGRPVKSFVIENAASALPLIKELPFPLLPEGMDLGATASGGPDGIYSGGTSFVNYCQGLLDDGRVIFGKYQLTDGSEDPDPIRLLKQATGTLCGLWWNRNANGTYTSQSTFTDSLTTGIPQGYSVYGGHTYQGNTELSHFGNIYAPATTPPTPYHLTHGHEVYNTRHNRSGWVISQHFPGTSFGYESKGYWALSRPTATGTYVKTRFWPVNLTAKGAPDGPLPGMGDLLGGPFTCITDMKAAVCGSGPIVIEDQEFRYWDRDAFAYITRPASLDYAHRATDWREQSIATGGTYQQQGNIDRTTGFVWEEANGTTGAHWEPFTLTNPNGTPLPVNLGGYNQDLYSNSRGEFISHAGLWRNGRLVPQSEYLPDSHLACEINPRGINKHGIILVNDCELWETGILLPVEVENQRGPIHELHISDSAPRIELDSLTNASVSVSGGQATVQIVGRVFDSITALLPPGTADLASLRVYLNGSRISAAGNLQRQSTDQGIWKPYGDGFTILPFTVSFPAHGTNLIRIETPQNAAGMIGKAEFEVNFRTELTPRPPIPAFIIAQDIILSGVLNPSEKDTVQLAAVNAAPSITLTETDDDTGVFVSTQGHAFVMTKTFTATGNADRLPCALMLPGSPMSFSLQGQSGQCMETGAQTMRFRYTETIPGRPQDSLRTEVLDSVQMHPIAKEKDGWFPFTLKMGGEIEGFKLQWFGKEFPIKSTSSGVCATTQDGKPLVGIVVKRSQEPANPEQDPPPPVLEFMYYDHSAGSIVRVPLDENQGKHTWKLMKDSQEVHSGELPLKQITFVNADGSRSDGILPLPIEALQSILEGGSPQLGPEQYAFIELRGHIDGEVVRFGNEEAPLDYYDLIAGEAETLLQEGPRHVRLEKLADRKFRTTQKVVIYGTSDTSQQELTESEWLALRDAGYLAIHNDEKKVFWGKEDIEWLTKERGSFHPPAGTKMGIGGVADVTDPKFYRFDGYEDHHLFNKFHAKWDAGAGKWIQNGKALAWDKLFAGDGFDVDEFTVPVRRKVHAKIGHLSNKGWESFLSEVFDEATGQLKPGITGKVLAQKRGEAFALMGRLVEEMGLELKWVRPYPQILKSVNAGGSLARRLIKSEGRLGESFIRLGSLSSKYLKFLGASAVEEGERLWFKHVKRFAKTAGKGVAKCLPLVFALQSHANALEALTYMGRHGVKEGAAVWLNLTVELEDLPLAREIVDQNWKMFEDLIAGADGKIFAQLPSGTVIKVGDANFACEFDSAGTIVDITPYVITNIWTFPDGRVKVRQKMTDDPYSIMEFDDAEWFIHDWYPAIGETRADWQEACQRAGAFNDYGDP